MPFLPYAFLLFFFSLTWVLFQIGNLGEKSSQPQGRQLGVGFRKAFFLLWWGQFSSFAWNEANRALSWWRYHGNTLHCSLRIPPCMNVYSCLIPGLTEDDCGSRYIIMPLPQKGLDKANKAPSKAVSAPTPLCSVYHVAEAGFNSWSISCIVVAFLPVLFFLFEAAAFLHLKIIRANNSSYSYTFLKVSWSKNPSLASCVCSCSLS